MKFTWKPIKNLDNLPMGEYIMMSDGRNVDYVRRGDVNCSENKEDWYYCYTKRKVQNPDRFKHYFIPRPASNEIVESTKKDILSSDNVETVVFYSIEFSKWIQNEKFATLQLGGKHIHKWHFYDTEGESQYVTSEELFAIFNK